MISLKQLLFGCWGSHDLIRDRRDGGYGQVCQRCGTYREMLTTPTITGPCHQQEEVPGKPVVKVKRVSERRMFAQGSRRA